MQILRWLVKPDPYLMKIYTGRSGDGMGTRIPSVLIAYARFSRMVAEIGGKFEFFVAFGGA